jgi:hypothetical protein
MTQDYTTPEMPGTQPKKSNTPLIIGIVVAVLLCCCCLLVAFGYWFYYYGGDQLLNSLGSGLPLIDLFL